MDSLTSVREAIKHLLNEVAERDNAGFVNADVKTHTVFDEEHGHYLVLRLGWQGQHRVKGIVLHVRVDDGLVWIEENWTERPIASELTKLGVPADWIILGFQLPSLRDRKEPAVA